jgi:hypothetical protein
MPSSPRLPRRVRLGRGYLIEVKIKSPQWFKERYGEILAGAFEAQPGKSPTGYIYLRSSLSPAQRWATYWHELMHALHDIAAWDAHRLRT